MFRACSIFVAIKEKPEEYRMLIDSTKLNVSLLVVIYLLISVWLVDTSFGYEGCRLGHFYQRTEIRTHF